MFFMHVVLRLSVCVSCFAKKNIQIRYSLALKTFPYDSWLKPFLEIKDTSTALKSLGCNCFCNFQFNFLSWKWSKTTDRIFQLEMYTPKTVACQHCWLANQNQWYASIASTPSACIHMYLYMYICITYPENYHIYIYLSI